MNAESTTVDRGPASPLTIRDIISRSAKPSPAAQHAIRFGTAVSLSLWLVFAYDLPEHTWAAITVIMVCQPGAGASIRKSLLRLMGTLAAALVSILVARLFAQQHPMMLASMFAVWGIGAYGMTGPRNQYAWSVFGFTSGIILVGALNPEIDIETLAFERACMVALGILIVFIVERLLWPESVETTLRTSLSERLRRIGESVRTSLVQFVPEDATKQTTATNLIADLTLVAMLRDELGVSADQARRLATAAELIAAMTLRSRELERRLAENPQVSAMSIRESTEDWASAFEVAATEISATLSSGATATSSVAAVKSRLEEMEKLRFEKLAKPREHAADESPWERLRTIAFASAVTPILEDLTRALEQLGELAGRPETKQPEPSSPEPAAPASAADQKKWWNSFDANRVEIGIRTGIAAAGSIVIMLVLGWTPNAAAATVAYNLAAAPTRGGFKTAAVGIVAVVLFAWGISDLLIVFVLPHVTRMPGILVIPFGVAAGFSYLGSRSPKLGAMTPILVLLVVLAIFGDTAPPQDVAGPYNTTVYFLLAVFAAIIAQSVLWPRRASDTFRQLAAAQLTLCGKGLRLSGASPRRYAVDTGGLLKNFAAGTAKLGQLHGQACQETEDDDTDAGMRSELLAKLSEVFDAIIHMRQLSDTGRAGTRAAGEVPESLSAALEREERAVRTSVRNTIAALKGETRAAPSELGDAFAATEALAVKPETWKSLADGGNTFLIDRVLAELDARHRIARQQLEIEKWSDRLPSPDSQIGSES